MYYCITADQVYTTVNHLGSLFIHSATTAFGISKNRHDSGKSKPWFIKECETKRDAFHEVKNRYTIYSVDKSDEVKTLLKKRYKEYKKKLNLNYKKNIKKNELDSLSKSNPKAFWNTLNKFSTNSCKTHDIPIDTLYDYFKTINANTNLDTDDEIDGIDINELCEILCMTTFLMALYQKVKYLKQLQS